MNVLVVILGVVVSNLYIQRVSLGYVYTQAVFCTYARDGLRVKGKQEEKGKGRDQREKSVLYSRE